MKTRTGKIARLPAGVREELNRRLEAAEPGLRLLPWLNSLPEVQALMQAGFGGAPITKYNLSDWRHGGYLDWQARQDFCAGLRMAPDMDADFKESGRRPDIDMVATVLTAHLGGFLARWNGEVTAEFEAKAHAFKGLGRTVVQMQEQARLDRRENNALLTACQTKACETVESSRTQSNHQAGTVVKPGVPAPEP